MWDPSTGRDKGRGRGGDRGRGGGPVRLSVGSVLTLEDGLEELKEAVSYVRTPLTMEGEEEEGGEEEEEEEGGEGEEVEGEGDRTAGWVS